MLLACIYIYTYICLPASAATWPLWLKHRSVASSSLMQSCAQGKFVLLLPQNISLDVALPLLIVTYLIGVLVFTQAHVLCNRHCRVHSHSYHTAYRSTLMIDTTVLMGMLLHMCMASSLSSQYYNPSADF